jgi:ribulose-phosphate 3-epimerase
MKEILRELDFVLLMSVNPGWGGQKLIPACLQKIRALKTWIQEEKLDIPIEVDGGINPDNLADLIDSGADIVVAGSAIFAAPDPAAVIGDMKRIARLHNRRNDP